MPDSKPDLEALLDEWIRDAAIAEPELAPHLPEIADHLRSAAAARITEGDDPAIAFAAAIEQFGDPRELSREFAKPRNPFGRALWWLADEQHEMRGDLTLAGSWIGMSALWAAAMIVTPWLGAPLDQNWMIVGWAATTFGPLTALDVKVRRMRAARSS